MAGSARRPVASCKRWRRPCGQRARVGPTPSLSLKPGARLVREWRGRTYTVTVTEDGFEYAGTSYPSLTKIAKKITGAHWSGPRFFGLLVRSVRAMGGAMGESDKTPRRSGKILLFRAGLAAKTKLYKQNIMLLPIKSNQRWSGFLLLLDSYRRPAWGWEAVIRFSALKKAKRRNF